MVARSPENSVRSRHRREQADGPADRVWHSPLSASRSRGLHRADPNQEGRALRSGAAPGRNGRLEQSLIRVATLARHDAGTLRELETEPRIPAAEAIRHDPQPRPSGTLARKSAGRTQDAHPERSMTGTCRIPSNWAYGRCWARTSDLRLVEAEARENEVVREWSKLHENPCMHRILPDVPNRSRPVSSHLFTRLMCD